MSAMKNVLAYAAAAEVLTGLALLIAPSLVGWLLLGDALVGIAVPVARVAGIALIGLGIACWPGPPRAGMLTYGGGVSLYLAYLAFAGSAGILLWPAGALHLLLTVLLTAERLATKRKGSAIGRYIIGQRLRARSSPSRTRQLEHRTSFHPTSPGVVGALASPADLRATALRFRQQVFSDLREEPVREAPHQPSL